MRYTLRFAISAVVLQAVACGGKSAPAAIGSTGGASSVCSVGSERCDCFANSSCNAGLECLSNLCVATATGSPNTGGVPPDNLAGGAASIGGTASATYATTGVGGVTNLGGTPAIGGASATVAAGGNTIAAGASGVLPGDSNVVDITQTEWDQINSDSCSGWTAEVQMLPNSVEFIVDTSGSMRDMAVNTTDGRAKWDITKSALKKTLDTMPSSTSVGLLLWPNMQTVPNINTDCAYCNSDGSPDPRGVGQCVNTQASVPIERLGAMGSAQRNSLTRALDSVDPTGGTPTADAFTYAINTNYGNPLQLGNNYALFITDGHPNIQLGCMGTGEEIRPVDHEPVLDSILGSLVNPPYVKTFVVGSPGSERASTRVDDSRGWLSEAAAAGGTQLTADCQNTGVPNYCHYELSDVPDFSAGLASALQDITRRIFECSYTFDDAAMLSETVNADKINVIYEINGSSAIGDMKLIGKASDPSCPEGNGWFMGSTDSSGKSIQLCPKTCAVIQQDPGAIIDIRGGCNLLPIIN